MFPTKCIQKFSKRRIGRKYPISLFFTESLCHSFDETNRILVGETLQFSVNDLLITLHTTSQSGMMIYGSNFFLALGQQ